MNSIYFGDSYIYIYIYIEEAIAETVAVETDSGSENVSTVSVRGEGDLR